jgi:hypothetical protein
MHGGEVKQQNSLELLQSVYRDEDVALHVRMRAAIECLPFENPKLGATAHVMVDGSFAQRLEWALARSKSPPLLNPPTINHEPLVTPAELRRPFPSYRRF